MPYSVFISHSIGPNELPIVNHLSASLTGAGVSAYLALYDRKPGTQLAVKVQSNIAAADVLLALLTKRGTESAWVQQEIGFAMGQRRRVIVFVERGVRLSGMLNGVEYFEFNPTDPGGAVDQMAQYASWLKSQKELGEANARAQAADARARAAGTIAVVAIGGAILAGLYALSRASDDGEDEDDY